MTRLMILLCAVVYVAADVKHLTNRNLDLFKYDPSDVYSLPEDIDDDKPPVIFSGDVMKAKVEKLQNLSGNKKYKLELKTQNGIEVSSVGKLRDDKTFVVSGSYSFTGADGKRYKTRYTADEFGYHPITELDLDIPEPQPLAASLDSHTNKFGADDKRNRFQFLNQNLNSDINQAPIRGSGQSGDDYSYSKLNSKDSHENHSNGYNINHASIKGSGQSGDDYSYSKPNSRDSHENHSNGYNINHTPIKGRGQSGDDYSYSKLNSRDSHENHSNGYNINQAPIKASGQSGSKLNSRDSHENHSNGYNINQAPIRSNGQSGDNKSYSKLNSRDSHEYESHSNGYNYHRPDQRFDAPDPSRKYLPVQ